MNTLKELLLTFCSAELTLCPHSSRSHCTQGEVYGGFVANSRYLEVVN